MEKSAEMQEKKRDREAPLRKRVRKSLKGKGIVGNMGARLKFGRWNVEEKEVKS